MQSPFSQRQLIVRIVLLAFLIAAACLGIFSLLSEIVVILAQAVDTVHFRFVSKTEVPGFARHVRFTLRSRHRQPAPAYPFGVNARNRCAIARCAGSPTASAVTGGKIVKTQNRCAHSSVEAVRLVCEHGGHG